MMQYDCEKRGADRPPCRPYSASHARRPLPPPPHHAAPTAVPLKVWIVASASCFAVCAALVLATVVITKWGTSETYSPREIYAEVPEPIYSHPNTDESEELNDIKMPILEKLSIFKNIVNREKKKDDLSSKPQIHPIHDTTLHHVERKIEKKDQPKTEIEEEKIDIPAFKPTLPDVFVNKETVKLTDGYMTGLKKPNDLYEDYYIDENLYDDYIQSNTITSYLIEKVQELHYWITSDPDLISNDGKKLSNGNEFGQVLKALNESLVEGNVTIIMSKLKDIYFGENYTSTNHSRKVILSNSTDLLSFGILSLDVMLLHNIQLMAWENQESARHKMLKDPDVFAFHALFMEPSKVEAKRNEVYHHYENGGFAKQQNLRDSIDDFDLSKNLLENVLEIGMSTARAAIHLGRAYKNTKNLLNQLPNRETLNANIQNQLSRNIDMNTHALHHLQTSYNKSDSAALVYTDLDCVWLLYCKNLMATAKLNPPYGTMARINGMALRMLTGELSADRALDTMLYEVLTGWTELKCNDMFPRCSKANAAAVVIESIIQPLRKSQSNRV